MAQDPDYTIEQLLAEANWARRLALHLVRDADHADDLLQETWRRALERAPRVGGSGGPRGWIATVLRNLASTWRRDAALRSFHESRLHRPEGSQPDDVEAHLKLQRALAEAVLGLREPYRTAITLRYINGLEIREIAAQQGASYEATRQRISRGIAILRDTLEAERREDGSAWHDYLAGFALAGAKPAWTIHPLREAVLVGTKAKLIAACAAIALLGGAWTWRAARIQSAGAERLVGTSPALAATGDGSVVDMPAPGASRASVASEPATPAALAPPMQPLVATVVARTVDESGAAVDAWLGYSARVEGAKLTPEPGKNGATGCKVEFESADSAAYLYLTFSAGGLLDASRSTSVRPGDALDLGEIRMERAALVGGRVVDVHGAPVADATVLCGVGEELPDREFSPRLGPRQSQSQTSSSSDGSFLFHALVPGPVRIWARSPGTRFAVSEVIRADADHATRDVVLQLQPLAPDEAFEVLVLAPDGSPIASAPIECRMQLADPSRYYRGGDALHATTDRDGRAFLAAQGAGRYAFRACDPSGRFAVAERAGLEPGATPIELRLAEYIPLALRVRDSNATPVESFGVRFLELGPNPREGWQTVLAPAIRLAPHAAGALELGAPTQPFRLEINAPGFELAVLGPIDAREHTGPIEVTLVPLASIRGRVRLGDAPLADAEVGLFEAMPPLQMATIDGFLARMKSSPAASARTDSDGRFELRVRQAGKFFACAHKTGLAPAELGPLELGPHTQVEGLELELAHGGSIEGRLLLPTGESAASILIVASRGDGRLEQRRTNVDGVFRLDALAAGRWLVERAGLQSPNGATYGSVSVEVGAELPSNCEVREGETTRFDLDLRRDEAQRLRGRLRIAERDRGRWQAYLESQVRSGRPSFSFELDSDGRFECVPSAPGAQTLYLDGATGSGASWTIRQELAAWSGVLDWELVTSVGAVRVRSLSGHAWEGNSAWLTWSDGAGVTVLVRSEVRDERELSVRAAPVGACRLSTRRDGAELELARFDVVEGETVEVELP